MNSTRTISKVAATASLLGIGTIIGLSASASLSSADQTTGEQLPLIASADIATVEGLREALVLESISLMADPVSNEATIAEAEAVRRELYALDLTRLLARESVSGEIPPVAADLFQLYQVGEVTLEAYVAQMEAWARDRHALDVANQRYLAAR